MIYRNLLPNQVFPDEHVQHQKFTDWKTFAGIEHARPRGACSISEEFSSCLFDQHDNIFNSNIFDCDEIEDTETRFDQHDNFLNRSVFDWNGIGDTETRLGTTPKASVPRSIVNREAEPASLDFDLNFLDSDFFNFDLEPRYPCLEHAAAASPTTPCEPVKRAPLMQHPQKRKIKTTQSRTRKRPFKNVRERGRRAVIKSKFAELNTLCSSDAVTSIVARPSGDYADVHRQGTQKPHKMDILRDSIHILQAMDKELIKLRARNKELRLPTCR